MKMLQCLKAFVCDCETWLKVTLNWNKWACSNEQWSNMAANANDSLDKLWNYVLKWEMCSHKYQPQREMIVQR